MTCHHTAWVELYRGEGANQLAYGSRVKRLIREIPQPSSACPQLVFLMGRRQKDLALRQLCRSSYRKEQVGISLRSDMNTLHCPHPRLFADCNPTSRKLPFARHTVLNCHPETVYEIKQELDEYSCQDLILTRLLFLFTNVICIFADDVGGVDGARQLLQTWIKIGSASSLPAAIRPRIVIVGSHSQNATQSLLDKEDLLFQLTASGNPFFHVFGDLEIFNLPPENLSPEARFLGLRREVTHQLQYARAARDRHYALFSATHFDAFFASALNDMSYLYQTFNFTKSARVSRPLDGAFAFHVTRFISGANKARLPYESIASHIASAVLMDAYPQGMHKFKPSTLFRSLYRRACHTALRACYSTDDLTAFQCHRIENFLSDLFQTMDISGAPSHQVHRKNIDGQRAYWGPVRSTKTCFWCIRRDPEHSLACGRMICDACVEMFGTRSRQDDYEYTINQRILCGQSNRLLVRLKPPTAAPRILSIDGGGPRGIIPLEILNILQELIGPEIQLPDLVDLQTGTSSGGIITLTLVLLRKTIKESKVLFKMLAKKVFSHRRHFLKVWFSDEIYDCSIFDEALKSHFGDIRRLLDEPISQVSSRKVSVTVSQIKGGEPCIFANYSGGAPHSKVYERLDPADDPLVWQVYFSTSTFCDLGTFQDGGMSGHNCPIELAMLEARRIWCTIPEPDVVISLGTENQAPNHDSNMTRFRNFLLDGFGPRCYRVGMESSVGKKVWDLFESKIPKESRWRYFRFDPSFPTALPPIGDTDCIDSLSTWVRKHPENWETYKLAARALLVSCFYFQLDTEPDYQAGQYFCTGIIQTRIPARPLVRRLISMDSGELGFYKDGMNIGLPLSLDNICEDCDRYFLPIRFFVRRLDDKVTLCLKVEADLSPLSNFPNSVQWFTEEQRLDCPFGPKIIPSGCTCSNHKRKYGVKRKYVEI
ncbi:hypothetical protein BDV12DRAFT_209311 [Aspergillus spectabilis]